MGKYLQDVLFYGPAFSSTSRKVSDEEKRNYRESYYETLKSLPLLKTLYNYYLPKRYETHYQIWRFIIRLEEQRNRRLEEVGHVADFILPFDNEALKTRSQDNRRAHLLELCQTGIQEICSFYRCPYGPFEEVYSKIKDKGIVLSEKLGKPVRSPNRQFTAQLHAFQSEDLHEMSVVIAAKSGEQLQKIKFSELPHIDIDEITWIDDSNLKVSYLHGTSIREKKISRDYFEVSMNGQFKFVPVTRKMLFQHAVHLISTGEEHLEEAKLLLKRAEAFGHGKAANILAQLTINPQERNISKLMQTPKKKFIEK